MPIGIVGAVAKVDEINGQEALVQEGDMIVLDHLRNLLHEVGIAGLAGGVNGDLLLLIQEEPNSTFRREGMNLMTTKAISIADAIKGGEITVNTLNGPARLNIDAGTQSGTVVKMRGKGLPAVSGYGSGTGDLYVKLEVFIPKKVSREDRELLDKLSTAESFQVK